MGRMTWRAPVLNESRRPLLNVISHGAGSLPPARSLPPPAAASDCLPIVFLILTFTASSPARENGFRAPKLI